MARETSRPIHDRRLTATNGRQEARVFTRIVLEVGILDDDVITMCGAQRCAHRSPLAAVHPVTTCMHTRMALCVLRHDAPRRVRGAVID